MTEWFIATFKGNPPHCYLLAGIALFLCGLLAIDWKPSKRKPR